MGLDKKLMIYLSLQQASSMSRFAQIYPSITEKTYTAPSHKISHEKAVLATVEIRKGMID